MNILKNFVREEQGQDLIEYALLLGFMVLVGAATIGQNGAAMDKIFTSTKTSLDAAGNVPAVGAGGGGAS